eukprot:7522766-Alexandrium_andersonii.AAC.1
MASTGAPRCKRGSPRSERAREARARQGQVLRSNPLKSWRVEELFKVGLGPWRAHGARPQRQ